MEFFFQVFCLSCIDHFFASPILKAEYNGPIYCEWGLTKNIWWNNDMILNLFQRQSIFIKNKLENFQALQA